MTKAVEVDPETGERSWVHQPNDRYVVTGIDKSGNRFRFTFDSWRMAQSINVWQGSRWLLRNGKRWLLQSIYN